MDYLESIGKVDSEMTFGNVGRPEYKYFVKNGDKNSGIKG